MKRVISLLLVLIMAFALLVSCGDEPTTPSGDGQGTNTGGNTGNTGGNTGDTGNTGGNTGGTGNTGGNTDGTGNTGDDVGDTPTTPWEDEVKFDDVTIKLLLSKLDDAELPTGCQKYMQGPESTLDEEADNATGFERVQNEVLLRNEAARDKLGLDVQYDYIAAKWGEAAAVIRDREQGQNAPDMYCDMMYDMSSLTIQNGIFANILKYTQEDLGVPGWVDGAGYFKISNVNGYNVSLMQDMALTDDKQFLIAGDYYMDVLRAMLVMPFNMEMYTNLVNPSDADCSQLYQDVLDGMWTWDMLMSFSKVYTGSGNASLESDNILMALSIGGLTATGLIYSTAFQCYTVEDDGTYSLNDTCSELSRIFSKASQLVTTGGVVCDDTTRGDDKGVIACKRKFTAGGALFAGPNMLGVIEETEFGEMGQLSILPIPKVGEYDEYNTAINSRARVGALSFHSTKKAETSAWIQYCTEHSDKVRAEYFDKAMNDKYMSGSGAKEMLDFIYANVGDNKSMILDQMIMAKDWINGGDYTWTQLIKAGDFTGHANDIDAQYKTAIQQKGGILDTILEEWNQSDPA